MGSEALRVEVEEKAPADERLSGVEAQLGITDRHSVHLCDYLSDMLGGLSEMAGRAQLTDLAVFLRIGAREANRERARLIEEAEKLRTVLQE